MRPLDEMVRKQIELTHAHWTEKDGFYVLALSYKMIDQEYNEYIAMHCKQHAKPCIFIDELMQQQQQQSAGTFCDVYILIHV